MKAMLFALWLAVTMVAATALLDMMSERSTMANIFGFLGVAAWAVFSAKTNCFTKPIKPKKK